MQKKYLAVNNYEKTEGKPISLKSGDRVNCLKESDAGGDWPDWIFCRADAQEGWVPRQIIKQSGDTGVILEDYNAAEFDLVKGEILIAEKKLNGWIWGFKKGSPEIRAWAPLNCLENTTIDIREYRQTDKKAVIDLWKACGLVKPWNNPDKDIERKLKIDPDLFLVGVYDNEIVGTVMGGYEGHRAWINYLAVTPDSRRNGYGRRLMKAVERLLLEKGAPKINLQIRSSNKSVIDFYSSIGFHVDDVLSMGKRLISDE